MAKKKAKAKAKQAKKKPAKNARKGPAEKKTASAVALEIAPEVPAADARRDMELDEGALASRIVTAVLAGLAAKEDGSSQSGSQPILGSIQGQLTAIESLLRDTSRAPAPHQPVAAVHASADSIINARREEIWRAELNQQKPLRLPRPTVVGRAMRELEPERLEDPRSFSASRRVFQWIRERGGHHLGKTVADLIEAKGKTASSSRVGLFETRFKRLQGHSLAEVKNDEWILTLHGARVFTDWPDWKVSDDDVECDGLLARVAPREPVVNTEAAAGGSDGGNRSGSGGLNSSTASQPSLLRPGGSGQP
jgi:hypothetical protein